MTLVLGSLTFPFRKDEVAHTRKDRESLIGQAAAPLAADIEASPDAGAIRERLRNFEAAQFQAMVDRRWRSWGPGIAATIASLVPSLDVAYRFRNLGTQLEETVRRLVEADRRALFGLRQETLLAAGGRSAVCP